MRFLLLLALLGANAALAQPDSREVHVSTEPLKLSGPRVGITYINGELADRLDDEFDAAPFIPNPVDHYEFEKQSSPTLIGDPPASFPVGPRLRGDDLCKG